MNVIMVVAVIIVLVVLVLAVVTTSKAYQFKHTVDEAPQPIDEKEDAQLRD